MTLCYEIIVVEIILLVPLGQIHNIRGRGPDGRTAMELAEALLSIRPVPHGVLRAIFAKSRSCTFTLCSLELATFPSLAVSCCLGAY